MNISIINDVSSNECINIIYNDIYTCVVQFKSLNNINIICDNDINDYILLLKETPYTIKYIDETNEFMLSFIFTYSGLKKSIQFIHEYTLYNNVSISNNQLFDKIQLIEKINMTYQQQINDLIQCNTSLLTKINTLEQDIISLKQHIQTKRNDEYLNIKINKMEYTYIKINNDDIYIKEIMHFGVKTLKKFNITDLCVLHLKNRYILKNISTRPVQNFPDIAFGEYKSIECNYIFNGTSILLTYTYDQVACIGSYEIGSFMA